MTTKHNISYSFTGNEIATILHALRSMQSNQRDDIKDACNEECDHFEGWESLTSTEIESLCERMNPLDTQAEPTPQRLAYIDAARESILAGHFGDSDDVEIDDGPDLNGDYPKISESEESGGAWVAAWLWVSTEEAGICEGCGEPQTPNNGEGWDGKCGSCADKAEAANEEN